MRIRSRHMGAAIAAALAIHVAAAIAMVLEPEEKGAAATGMGGLEISLGPSGGAPGSVANVVSEIEPADTVVPAATPDPATPDPVAPDPVDLDTATPDSVAPEKAAIAEAVPQAPVDRPLQAVRPAEAPAPAPADVAIQPVERLEAVDEVIAVVRPQPLDRPEPEPEPEPAKAENVPLSVAPEPVAVARLEKDASVVEAPPLPVIRPAPPTKVDVRKAEVSTQPTAAPATAAIAPADAASADTPQPAASRNDGAQGRSGAGQSAQAGSTESRSGGGRPGVSVDYYTILQAWLEEHKEYPRRARNRRQQGVVWLYFVMDRQGHVLEHRIDRSSGYDLLDREVEAMIARAQPLPAIPADMTQARLELVVPVQFQLR